MLADFFTKPLQGALFTRFRDVILGHKHVDSLNVGPTPEPEERVGIERADGHGTDEPDDSGFTLVKGRRKYKNERGYEAVAPVPVNVSVNEWTGKKKLVNEGSKDVSRAHSFETIPLIE